MVTTESAEWVSQIKRSSLNSNRVFVKLTRLGDKYNFSTGTEIHIAETTDFSRFAKCVGEVVNICGCLTYAENTPDQIHTPKGVKVTRNWYMKYDVPLELQRGDTIYFHYACISEAEREGFYWKDGTDHYLLLHYEDIYVRKRGGNIYPINGFILAEPIEKEQPQTNLIIPDSVIGVSTNACRVTHVGALVKEYGFGRNPYRPADVDWIKVGDEIILDDNSLIPVENDLWESVEGKKTLYRFHRCDIRAKGIGDDYIAAPHHVLIEAEKLEVLSQTKSGLYTVNRGNEGKYSTTGTVINSGVTGVKNGDLVYFKRNVGVQITDNILAVKEPDILYVK